MNTPAEIPLNTFTILNKIPLGLIQDIRIKTDTEINAKLLNQELNHIM